MKHHIHQNATYSHQANNSPRDYSSEDENYSQIRTKKPKTKTNEKSKQTESQIAKLKQELWHLQQNNGESVSDQENDDMISLPDSCLYPEYLELQEKLKEKELEILKLKRKSEKEKEQNLLVSAEKITDQYVPKNSHRSKNDNCGLYDPNNGKLIQENEHKKNLFKKTNDEKNLTDERLDNFDKNPLLLSQKKSYENQVRKSENETYIENLKDMQGMIQKLNKAIEVRDTPQVNKIENEIRRLTKQIASISTNKPNLAEEIEAEEKQLKKNKKVQKEAKKMESRSEFSETAEISDIKILEKLKKLERNLEETKDELLFYKTRYGLLKAENLKLKSDFENENNLRKVDLAIKLKTEPLSDKLYDYTDLQTRLKRKLESENAKKTNEALASQELIHQKEELENKSSKFSYTNYLLREKMSKRQEGRNDSLDIEPKREHSETSMNYSYLNNASNEKGVKKFESFAKKDNKQLSAHQPQNPIIFQNNDMPQNKQSLNPELQKYSNNNLILNHTNSSPNPSRNNLVPPVDVQQYNQPYMKNSDVPDSYFENHQNNQRLQIPLNVNSNKTIASVDSKSTFLKNPQTQLVKKFMMHDKQTQMQKEVYLIVDVLGKPILDPSGNPTLFQQNQRVTEGQTMLSTSVTSKSPQKNPGSNPLHFKLDNEFESQNSAQPKGEGKRDTLNKNLISKNFANTIVSADLLAQSRNGIQLVKVDGNGRK